MSEWGGVNQWEGDESVGRRASQWGEGGESVGRG